MHSSLPPAQALTATLIAMSAVAALGVILALVGAIIWRTSKSKASRCTARTTGHVSGYLFWGEGHMAPKVAYEVHGEKYEVTRKYRGVVTTSRASRVYSGASARAYISDREWVHIPVGSAVTNFKAIAQKLWPMDGAMQVFYNLRKPEEAFAEKLPTKMPSSSVVLLSTGAGLIVLAAVLAAIFTRLFS